MSIHSVSINKKSILKSDVDKEGIESIKITESEYLCVHQNKSYQAILSEIDTDQKKVKILLNGKSFECQIVEQIDHTLKELNLNTTKKVASKHLISTMPGLVLSLMVEEGESIEEGQPLMILEAMKMENVLKANSDGVISKILCKKGEAVDKRQLLIEID